MDILDIDEVLRNDSFTCLEGKTHDDVSNILRQWKQNQNPLPQSICALEENLLPTAAEASFDGMHQNNRTVTTTSTTNNFTANDEQMCAIAASATNNNNNNNNSNNSLPFKINTRTFTRPKRKNAHGLETHSLTPSYGENDDMSGSGGMLNRHQKPILNMHIGGLVTSTLQKSMLQDTSPPSSICSSINASFDNMNNSLITSADFTNISFLKSSNSIEYDNLQNEKTINAITENNYTLQDMIRDRQKLESLTMSNEDGTLIKDTNIAQIDEISLLTLSKPTSSCSTMDNSTDSVEAIFIYGNSDKTYEKQSNNDNKENELKSNYTFNFQEGLEEDDDVENNKKQQADIITTTPKYQKQQEENDENTNYNSPFDNNMMVNETYRKPSIPLMEQTVCLSTPKLNEANITFDKQLPELFGETSTPETTKPLISLYSNRRNQQRMLDALNEELSPIILHQHKKINNNNINKNHSQHQQQQQNQQQQCENNIENNIKTIMQNNDDDVNEFINDVSKNDVNEAQQDLKKINKSKSNNLKSSKLILTDDNLDDVDVDFYDDHDDEDDTNNDNKNEIKLRGIAQSNERNMQHVRDLAKAEAQYLTGNENEDEFEHMLDDIGRIDINPEHLKMKRSLETIKKRLNCALNTKITTNYNNNNDNNNEQQHHYQQQQQSQQLLDSTTIINNGDGKNSTAGSGLTIAGSCSSSISDHDNIITNTTTSERLLSRRSRLYDDANLSSILTASISITNKCNATTTNFDKTSVELSYDNSSNNVKQQQQQQQLHEYNIDDKNDDCADNNNKKYKKLERREHCRNRFKTIKLTKERAENVPCIDDDYTNDDYYNNQEREQQQHQQYGETKIQPTENRYSRHDQHNNSQPIPKSAPASSLLSLYNHNSNSHQFNNDTVVTDTLKYATFKKPKNNSQYSKKPISYQQQQQQQQQLLTEPSKIIPNERRATSRPRYLSGLPKYSLVSKANSTHNLDHDDATSTLKQKTIGDNSNSKLRELKSPMGMKSKSYSNLITNNAPNSTVVTTFGLKKGINSHDNSADVYRQQQQQQHQEQFNKEHGSKMLKPSSGLRAAYNNSLKPSALARPSSAYNSVHYNTARNGAQLGSTCDMTFASQETVIISDNNTDFLSSGSGSSVRSTISDRQNSKPMPNYNSSMETKHKPTGISKPSGLRQPTIIKRSALPRPTSYVKR